MYQTNLNLPNGSNGLNPVRMTELALRSAEQLYDMNVSATRALLQTQVGTAKALGLPDWSSLFDMATNQTRQAWSAGSEQVLTAAQRTTEVATELQRSASQILEAQTAQTAQAAETLKQNMQELTSQAAQALNAQTSQAQQEADIREGQS
ncbi:MAG: hypothetical protein EOO15_03880 [Chitinophagaceae bacterium]|nr:MAG: hypothetical protein EOO15_03880 [Chitinophagaceae bacterium]